MRTTGSRIVIGVVVLALTGLVADAPAILSADDTLLLDTVYLQSGGKILGKTSEITEGKQKFWLVETPDGGILKLKKSQVRQRVVAPAAGPEYLKRVVNVPDTVDGHWEMQDWCNENRLPRQREHHLMQIIRIDPDHTAARSRLGYRIRNGAWVHDDHFYQNHGYVTDDRGNPRLPDSLAMADNKDARHQTTKGWTVKIKSAIRKYERRSDASALQEISAITDPAAVEGLWDALQDQKDPRVQRLLIETLGGIKSAFAQKKLVDIVMATDLGDPLGRDYRELCARLLKQPHFSQSGVVESVSGFLNPGPDTPNDQVQKAAWLIGQMGDVSAVPVLIDGLVTTHRHAIAGPAGNVIAGQGSNGRGMKWGDNKPKFRMVQYENLEALNSLRMLTESRDYGFDEEAWLNWYINTRSVGMSHLGRDE